LALPVPAACIWETLADEAEAGLTTPPATVVCDLLGVALGFAVALLVLLFFGWLDSRALHPSERLPGLLPLDPPPSTGPPSASGGRAWVDGRRAWLAGA